VPAYPTSWFRIPIVALAVLLAGLWLMRGYIWRGGPRHVAYSELVADVEAGKVESVEMRVDQIAAVTRGEGGKAGEALLTERIPNLDERPLVEAMETQHVVISAKPHASWWSGPVLWVLLLGLALPALFLMFGAGLGRGAGRNRPMTFSRSKAKLFVRSREHSVTFADVAGVEESKAELMEVVRFLMEPERYRAIGAHVPKGVLLVGAPGTGKTLLARAVAGESGVPFFSMSGSEFVEMFVGVGAGRVRDLFEQAKARAPCIVFIDELDAVGKTRSGAGGFVANEEREQTLNQLLIEMDGFECGSGLVIMAATNRPEVLDKALLRAGRFDRQVLVDRPDVRGREAILRVHARRVQLAAEVDIAVVARRTPGMVGADLANVVNESALACVRRDATVVEMRDFEEAIDRLQLGLKKAGRIMTDDEKRRVAFHEAGHALVALTVSHADPVHRVTIIPRSIGSLGATLQLPTEDRYLMTYDELRDRLCVLLGGRSAEEVACGGVSTGAQDDLERATALAKLMVCRFGMSELLGPMTWGRSEGARFLAAPGDTGERDYSEQTARSIDAEVKRIIGEEHARALDFLGERRETLESIAGELLVRETLEGAELDVIVRAHSGRHPAMAAAE
jgi:cell division protease FtsH